ncbi:MAG: bifunctional hydroxymethylpyrimidine kinase/phosphomethylpyrimidine kinase [Parvularculaceae bacterium]|nr:bifunctional hydroxymethylpyrimidine kinase/phosphomethylpyrimidine kinase [Parvularculaceae bacterium]
MKGRVLIIAGSDPSGGAGIQADIKTVTALGGYAATAITALTVQDTTGVSAVHAVEPDVIAAQIAAVLGDIGADAIKIGMIGDKAAGVAIADAIAFHATAIPVVLDPVLIATSGDALAGEGVAGLLLERLTPLAAVITPNADEARALTGLTIETAADLVAAGEALMRRGATAALVKGGHLKGDVIEDALVTHAGVERFRHPRIGVRALHGTGCTLASAVATGLAQGMALGPATKRAIEYVQGAIRKAPGFGAGASPLNHAWMLNGEPD